MSSVELRPPLPEMLPHREVRFIAPCGSALPPATLAAIALAITEALPAGDFSASADGTLVFSPIRLPWDQAAREEALERATA